MRRVVLGQRGSGQVSTPSRRGSALALSLVSVMIIAGLGASLLQLQMSIDRKSEFAIDRRRAVYLAEAGIAEAALAVSSGRTGIIASKAVPAIFGNGVYWVESDDLPNDRIVLRCTAQVGRAELVIQSMILPSVNPVTSLGVFGSEGVTVGWGTIIDGYHSGRGDYASQVDPSAPVLSTGSDGLIGSDGNITLEDSYSLRVPQPTPTHIFGAVRPGRHNSLLSSGLPEVHGSVKPYDAPPYLPQVTLPSPTELIGTPQVILIDQLGVGATMATHVQGAVDVVNGATLTIAGPKVLRCTSLSLETGATLVLDDALGPIHIYAEEGLNFETGSVVQSIAPEADARGTFLLVPGTAAATGRVVISSTGLFHGAIYAPDDVVIIPEGLRWIGSAVARLVVTNPGAHITIDRRLTLGCDGFASLPRQLSWQLVPLGKEVARHLSVEPRLALAMRGITPVPSAVASPETNVEIQYMDLYDQPGTYRGAFAAFDRTQAQRIIGARWEDPRDLSSRTWTSPVGSESTDAVERLRKDLRELRSTVQLARPTVDVAIITDDEAIEEAAASINLATLATQPESIQRAVQRADATAPTVPTLSGTPLQRANRAANAANDLANTAQATLNTANGYDPATLTAAALVALEDIRLAAFNTAGKAENTKQQALLVSGGPIADQEQHAANAVTFCLEAVDSNDAAQAAYTTFLAAL